MIFIVVLCIININCFLVWCSHLYGRVVGGQMRDQVDFPADQTVIRETGYDSDGNSTIRVEVRTLLSYSRVLLDNNNAFAPSPAPGFRMQDLSPDIITMLNLYHEHRNSNPCKYFI